MWSAPKILSHPVAEYPLRRSSPICGVGKNVLLDLLLRYLLRVVRRVGVLRREGCGEDIWQVVRDTGGLNACPLNSLNRLRLLRGAPQL